MYLVLAPQSKEYNVDIGDHWLAIAGVVILIGAPIFVALVRKRNLNRLIRVGTRQTDVPATHGTLKGDFDWTETIHSDIRLFHDLTIDAEQVVELAHMLACYYPYCDGVKSEYANACSLVAKVATEWIHELVLSASSGNVEDQATLLSVRRDKLPANLDLYVPSNEQPNITAYEAFLACGVPSLLGGLGKQAES